MAAHHHLMLIIYTATYFVSLNNFYFSLSKYLPKFLYPIFIIASQYFPIGCLLFRT